MSIEERPPMTQEPQGGGVDDDGAPRQQSADKHGNNLNSLVPWCGVGFISFFTYIDFPACIGCRLAGDILCCTLE